MVVAAAKAARRNTQQAMAVGGGGGDFNTGSRLVVSIVQGGRCVAVSHAKRAMTAKMAICGVRCEG